MNINKFIKTRYYITKHIFSNCYCLSYAIHKDIKWGMGKVDIHTILILSGNTLEKEKKLKSLSKKHSSQQGFNKMAFSGIYAIHLLCFHESSYRAAGDVNYLIAKKDERWI